MRPPVRLMPNTEICFVSRMFAAMRQTQKSMLKSMKSTLTCCLLCVIFLVLLKGVFKYPCDFCGCKVRHFFSETSIWLTLFVGCSSSVPPAPASASSVVASEGHVVSPLYRSVQSATKAIMSQPFSRLPPASQASPLCKIGTLAVQNRHFWPSK